MRQGPPQGPKAAFQRGNGGAGLRLYLEPLRQPVNCSSETGDTGACWPSGGDTGHGSEGGPLSALATVRVQSPSRAEPDPRHGQPLSLGSGLPTNLSATKPFAVNEIQLLGGEVLNGSLQLSAYLTSFLTSFIPRGFVKWGVTIRECMKRGLWGCRVHFSLTYALGKHS